MKRSYIIIILIILASFAIGIYLYPDVPEKMASHWNAQGQVDGYISKFWGLFLMPIISLALFLLFTLIPKIDPLKENIAKFRKYFDGFIVLIMAFLFYLYLLTIAWNLNFKFNFVQLLAPAFAVLFYYVGVLTENAKRNWFIGVRTPWTLSNEEVWNKTHKLGGKLFKSAGIITLLGILLPSYAIFFAIVPAISVSLYLLVYSYFEYQRQINQTRR